MYDEASQESLMICEKAPNNIQQKYKEAVNKTKSGEYIIDYKTKLNTNQLMRMKQ